MKTIKTLITLLILFFSFLTNAQTLTPLPQFKNETVIVRTNENIDGYVDISDGSEVKYSGEFASPKLKHTPENISLLAQIFNGLKKQKYKLIGTNSLINGYSITTTYILQKE